MLLNSIKVNQSANLLRTVVTASLIAISLSFASTQAQSQQYRRVEYSVYDMEPVSGDWFKLSQNVSIGGRVFANAGQVFMHKGDHQAVFSNRIGADVFESWVGVADDTSGQAEARFAVKGDGQILWQSDWIAKGDAPQKVSVPIKGYSGLTLLITNWRYQDGLGDGCLFAEPKLVRLHPLRRPQALSRPRNSGGHRYSGGYSSSHSVRVLVNGQVLSFPGTPAQRMGSRVMVPMRPIFEALGCSVNYEPASGQIVATTGTVTNARTVQMKAGSRAASLDGRTLFLDQPPLRLSGATLVPLRFVAEATGVQVDWNATTSTVTVSAAQPNVSLR